MNEDQLLCVKQKILDECMCLSYEEPTIATQSASESVPLAPKKCNIGSKTMKPELGRKGNR